jgi:carboxymethylenebutenolidase
MVMGELVPIPSPGIPLYYGAVGDPAVVVVHDWYGRLPGLDPFATALASRGFRVVVPDLYDGFCTTSQDDAANLMQQLDIGLSLSIIEDAVDEARMEGSQRSAVVGFSMGGWLALLHAQRGSIDALVAYYATLGARDHGVIPCPVLLHFAEIDEWDEGDDPDSFVDRLDDHGTPVVRFSYAGTGHSFANASVPSRLDARAAALAFARTTTFLEKHLLD